MSLQDLAGLSDATKGIPGPLGLARMHEAELKRCYRQYGLLGALVRQIMVGRVVTVASSVPIEITDVKLDKGAICLFGKPNGKKRQTMLCYGLAGVTIVEGAKP